MNWPNVKLGELVDILSGFAFHSAKFSKEAGIPLIRIRDVVRGFTETRYNGEFDKKYQIFKGDLLIGMDGEFNIAEWGNDVALLNQRVCRISPNNQILDKRFLFHFLPKELKKIEDETPFVTVKHLSVKKIQDINITLPPLHEQKRIALILDKATEIKAKREQAIAKLDELLLSAFQECCLKSASQSAVKIKNVVTKVKLNEKSDARVWSLALDQIESNSGKIISQVMVDKAKLGSSTYYFEPEVVLYSKLRPYLNKVVIPDTHGYATTELVPLYCDKEKILPSFMMAFLRSARFVEYANTNSAGAKMPRVMMDKFWDYEMLLPDLNVQQKFKQLNDQINALKDTLTGSIVKQDALIASLQQQAFTTGFNA